MSKLIDALDEIGRARRLLEAIHMACDRLDRSEGGAIQEVCHVIEARLNAAESALDAIPKQTDKPKAA